MQLMGPVWCTDLIQVSCLVLFLYFWHMDIQKTQSLSFENIIWIEDKDDV